MGCRAGPGVRREGPVTESGGAARSRRPGSAEVLGESRALDGALRAAVAGTRRPRWTGRRGVCRGPPTTRGCRSGSPASSPPGGTRPRRAALVGLAAAGFASAANLLGKRPVRRDPPGREAARVTDGRYVPMPSSASFPRGTRPPRRLRRRRRDGTARGLPAAARPRPGRRPRPGPHRRALSRRRGRRAPCRGPAIRRSRRGRRRRCRRRWSGPPTRGPPAGRRRPPRWPGTRRRCWR